MNDSRAFFGAERVLYGPAYNRECPMRSSDGLLLRNVADIRVRWKEYYDQLLNTSLIVQDSSLDLIPQYPMRHDLEQLPSLKKTNRKLIHSATTKLLA